MNSDVNRSEIIRLTIRNGIDDIKRKVAFADRFSRLENNAVNEYIAHIFRRGVCDSIQIGPIIRMHIAPD